MGGVYSLLQGHGDELRRGGGEEAGRRNPGGLLRVPPEPCHRTAHHRRDASGLRRGRYQKPHQKSAELEEAQGVDYRSCRCGLRGGGGRLRRKPAGNACGNTRRHLRHDRTICQHGRVCPAHHGREENRPLLPPGRHGGHRQRHRHEAGLAGKAGGSGGACPGGYAGGVDLQLSCAGGCGPGADHAGGRHVRGGRLV